MVTQWADLNFYNPTTIDAGNWRSENGFATDDYIILYAGIIGIAQGLEIIPKTAEFFRDQKNIRFVMIGAGPETSQLQAMIQSKGLHNVSLLPAVLKEEMPSILKSVNAALIPLRKLELFRGAIPSKIFEALAMELPLLLGVDGESRELFINQGKCGMYFEPENHTSLVAAIKLLISNHEQARQMGVNGRKFVLEHFNRATIAENFAYQLETLSSIKK